MNINYKAAITKKARYGDEKALRERFCLDQRARLFIVLIEKWGMVTGYLAGEDTAGRSKLELMPVQEVVTRAAMMTELAMQVIEQKGWFQEVNPKDLEEEIA